MVFGDAFLPGCDHVGKESTGRAKGFDMDEGIINKGIMEGVEA